MSSPLLNLRQFVKKLRIAGEVVDVYEEVDPNLEIAEIHRRIAAADGPALFFHRVKGSPFPVVTNLFGSRKRVDLAFENRPDQLIASLVELLTHRFPPKPADLWSKRKAIGALFSLGTKKIPSAPVREKKIEPPNLEQLPMLKTWPLDGGHFITLPIVYTEPPGGGSPNIGMYRIQRYSKTQTGLHFQIQKGGGFHFHQAEAQNQPLPVHIYVGGPPALILSAITPLPENVSELLIAGLLQGKKLAVTHSDETPYPFIAECEFALIGKAHPNVRHPEGPFGDHYGYYSWTHDFPLFECEALYHRKDAIYPATIVGKPRQEDYYIGEYLQDLLSPLFPVVMPSVKSLWSFGETGFHSLTGAIIRERHYRESMTAAFRILGEGQLSLSKFLLLTDQPINIRNFKDLLTAILERFRPETDLFIFSHLCMDTLDYTGPELNKGSRGVMVGTGEKIRDLPPTFIGTLPSTIHKASSFSPGCLVLESTPYEKHQDLSYIYNHPDFATWPLLVLVDNLSETLKNTTSFLWTVFTRFEPAADMHASSSILYNHISFKGPVLIDARMKPNYPPPVSCDPETAEKVTRKWTTYFPIMQAMGDSEKAHIA
jgi:UbiD family decarboxylase